MCEAGHGADGIVHTGNAREPEVLDMLLAAVAANWARLDTLVDVVGCTFRGPFNEQSPRASDALRRSDGSGWTISITRIESYRASARAAVGHLACPLQVELGHDHIRVSRDARTALDPLNVAVSIPAGESACRATCRTRSRLSPSACPRPSPDRTRTAARRSGAGSFNQPGSGCDGTLRPDVLDLTRGRP